MTTRVFRSTDPGAPQLPASGNGGLLAILRACLVDGYGVAPNTRTPAGWTMPFSDLPNNLACFKTVNGDYLRLDDNRDYRFATASGFKTMTDEHTGTEEYPSSVSLGTGKEFRLYKRRDNSPDYNGWIVIASDDWLYYYTTTTGASNVMGYACGFFFGKYDCLNPTFTENWAITGQTTDINYSNMNYTYTSLFASNVDYYLRRNYQNAQVPTKVHNKYTAYDWINPNPFTGSLEIYKVPLIDLNTPATRYGYLANLHHVMGIDNRGFVGGEILNINGQNYIALAWASATFLVEFDVDSN